MKNRKYIQYSLFSILLSDKKSLAASSCLFIQSFPKIINPQDKENYKYLVNRCNQYAKRHYGRISAVVDYARWDSKINLYLPMLEFTTEEDIAVISEHTGSCAN